MSELAKVVIERHAEIQVVRIAGEVDISNAGELEDHISEAVPNDAAGLVIDLSDTGFLDSAGIRMLFELGERLGGRRQEVAIVVPPESLIRHSLVVTEVAQALPMHDTLDDAVDALRRG
jgi:anti-anti-sigma factor